MLIDYDEAVWAVAVQLAFEADLECSGEHNPEDYLSVAKMYFNKIEAIEEPKTGRWIEEYNGNGWNDYWDYTCSVCEKTLKRGEPYPYCPNCGAEMKAEEDDVDPRRNHKGNFIRHGDEEGDEDGTN